MPKLSDVQLTLLSAAAKRWDASFYPVPDELAGMATNVTNAMLALRQWGFAEEREIKENTGISRTDGDLNYGFFITDLGVRAISASDVISSVSYKLTHCRR